MALRLIIETDGEHFRLVHKRHVDMIPPAPAAPVDPQREGVYAEVRNERDEPLYQQHLSAQLEPSMEVFSPDQSIHRVDVAQHKRTIMLVVPADAAARSLVFLQSRPSVGGRLRAEATAAPQELGRILLTDEDT